MKKLVVLTGAGMSAESGIATFRDHDGLWEQYSVEDVASIEGWYRNPELMQKFYNQRRRESLAAKPNAGHNGLVELEQWYDVKVVTQNIDSLHEKAGSKNVIHLHGELMKSCSDTHHERVYDIDPEHPDLTMETRDKFGDLLRPFIVWFGEAVPMFEAAAEEVRKADVLVIIGTSMVVYPAAGLIGYARADIPVYLIDPKPVKVPYDRAVTVIQKGAGEGVKELIEILKKEA